MNAINTAFFMDCDEFYVRDQFEYMKETIVKGGYESAACLYCFYYKDSIYQVSPKEKKYVSTIYKINEKTKFVYRSKKAPVPIDPTRKTNNSKYIVFKRSEVEMHHMSFVRKDIRKKLMSSSARKYFFEKIGKVTDHYENWKYPEPIMWANGSIANVIKIDRVFEIYPT